MVEKIVANYKLIEIIGVGGMSTVYLGRHAKTGSIAAIKILKEQYTQEEDHVKKFFIREIEVTKKLNHKNIVKLLSYGKKNDKYYLIYEYIDGLSLDKFLAKKKKLSVKAIEKIVLQILAGLTYAHSMEIVHRDIKPQNILVTDSGITKITDFGIAKAVSSATITQTGLFMGSPAYISPEQAEGKEVYASSDIYSLGVILYEMLTRKLPFTASTTWGIVNKHINEPAPDISKIAKDTPDYLARSVSRCLNKNPQNRFTSAEEMAYVINAKLYTGKTIIKRIEEIEIEPEIEVGPEVDKEENKISLKDRLKSINKKKLSIGAVIAVMAIWVVIGSTFYFTGNKYYNEDKYINAAHSFKAAQNMLIPNARNSKISSLGYCLYDLKRLIESEEYEAVVIDVEYIEENFPEYTEVENLKVKLSKAYDEKKEEYLVLIGNESFTKAKDILITMSEISGKTDSFVEEELGIIEDYAQSETYINQASIYLDEGSYDQMFKMIDLATDLTPDYSGIDMINSRIEDEYDNLKNIYRDYSENYDFDNSLITLDQMISLRKGNDSYSEDQIEIVYRCIDSENYISNALDMAERKDFNSALLVLEEALGLNPEYQKILIVSEEIKVKHNEYNSFIAKINNIANLNSGKNYLDAYNQANSLLNNSEFAEAVLQDDIDRLNGIKSSAYNSGKNIPGNNVSFNLYASNGWQSNNINNIFGQKLYTVEFGGRTFATDKPSRDISCIVVVGGNIGLFLYTSDNLEYSDNRGKLIKVDKRDYPNASGYVAKNGGSYSFSSQNRTFIVTVNSMSKSNYWFESLAVTVSIQ